LEEKLQHVQENSRKLQFHNFVSQQKVEWPNIENRVNEHVTMDIK